MPISNSVYLAVLAYDEDEAVEAKMLHSVPDAYVYIRQKVTENFRNDDVDYLDVVDCYVYFGMVAVEKVPNGIN